MSCRVESSRVFTTDCLCLFVIDGSIQTTFFASVAVAAVYLAVLLACWLVGLLLLLLLSAVAFECVVLCISDLTIQQRSTDEHIKCIMTMMRMIIATRAMGDK